MLNKAMLALALLLATGGALSNNDADHTYKYSVSKEKSPGDMILQVHPPAGFDRVVVKQGDELQKSSSMPAYFKFKNQPDQVTVTLMGGKAWVDIVLPLFRDTFHELRVSAELVPGRPAAAAPAAAPTAASAKYIGRIRNCRDQPRRFAFLRNDVELGNVTVNGQQRKDFSVPAGDYTVRIFTVGEAEEKLIRVERNFRVAGDEWALNYFCTEAAAAAAARPQPRTGTLSSCAPYLNVLVTFLQNGNPAKTVTIGTGQNAQVALMPGNYMVRRQAAARPEDRALWNDAPLTVPNQDGWQHRCGV